MLLLLKLVLAPLLVALATLVARRWGPKIGGVVVGLPLSTGPIFLFLAIDQGLAFAESMRRHSDRLGRGGRLCADLYGCVPIRRLGLLPCGFHDQLLRGLCNCRHFVTRRRDCAGTGCLPGSFDCCVVDQKTPTWLDQVSVTMVGHLASHAGHVSADLGGHNSGGYPRADLQWDRWNVSDSHDSDDTFYTSPIRARRGHRHVARQRVVVDRLCKLFSCHGVGSSSLRTSDST